MSSNYRNGKECFDNKQYRKAVYFLAKSTDEDKNDHAKGLLGYCKLKGLGCEKDEKAALFYLRAAADKTQNMQSQFHIGLCYLSGIGCSINKAKAKFYLQKSAAKGHSGAKSKLAELTASPSKSLHQHDVSSASVSSAVIAPVVSSSANTRLLNAPCNPKCLSPITGWEYAPDVSLKNSFTELKAKKIVYSIDQHVTAALEFATALAPQLNIHNLSIDEIAAIHLYTQQWTYEQQSVYSLLNKYLRKENRGELKIWFPYYKILMNGLLKLPNANKTVWRGINHNSNYNAATSYKVQHSFRWWAFSSTTTNSAVLKNPQFFNSKSNRTLFSIDCKSGKSIHQYSRYKEEEILLLPGTKLMVKAQAPNITDKISILILAEVTD